MLLISTKCSLPSVWKFDKLHKMYFSAVDELFGWKIYLYLNKEGILFQIQTWKNRLYVMKVLSVITFVRTLQ